MKNTLHDERKLKTYLRLARYHYGIHWGNLTKEYYEQNDLANLLKALESMDKKTREKYPPDFIENIKNSFTFKDPKTRREYRKLMPDLQKEVVSPLNQLFEDFSNDQRAYILLDDKKLRHFQDLRIHGWQFHEEIEGGETPYPFPVSKRTKYLKDPLIETKKIKIHYKRKSRNITPTRKIYRLKRDESTLRTILHKLFIFGDDNYLHFFLGSDYYRDLRKDENMTHRRLIMCMGHLNEMAEKVLMNGWEIPEDVDKAFFKFLEYLDKKNLIRLNPKIETILKENSTTHLKK